MPKRIAGITLLSPDVQGEDSWIVVKPMTVGQFNRNARIAQRAQAGNPEGADLEKETQELFSEIVLDWNWVDDDGNPLPKPFNNPAAFGLLNMVEVGFIGEAAARANNPEKKDKPK